MNNPGGSTLTKTNNTTQHKQMTKKNCTLIQLVFGNWQLVGDKNTHANANTNALINYSNFNYVLCT